VRHPEAPPSSGIPTSPGSWPYNAQPVLLKNSTKSRPQRRNADNTSNGSLPVLLSIQRLATFFRA
jgi:hypothetical protein